MDTTDLKNLRPNDEVNLEQALKANDKIAGHIVTGHIDTTGVIRKKDVSTAGSVFEVAVDKKFMKNIVEKGSIAVDGISLTVAKVNAGSFIVNIIPHTLKITALGFKKHGDTANLEFDILGKYIQKASYNTPSKITEEYLREHGF